MARSRIKEISEEKEKTLSAAMEQPALPDEEVLAFTKAIDEYRRLKNRPFPTWSEVLQVLHSLGYRKQR